MNVASRLVGAALLSLSLAWFANAIVYFHSSYTRFDETRTQYVALANSPLCSDSVQRLASADVNRCSEAMRHVEKRTLSPVTMALLETLQHTSICGKGEGCAGLVRQLLEAWFQIVGVLLMLLCGAIYLLRQKWAIDRIISAELPLTCSHYPTRVPIYAKQYKTD